MTICSQNLNEDELAKLETMREDPEFDKKLGQIVQEAIADVGGGSDGALQQEIDARIRRLLQTS